MIKLFPTVSYLRPLYVTLQHCTKNALFKTLYHIRLYLDDLEG